MTRPPLALLCGPAFSGKTTLAAALAARFGYTRIALDDINARRGLDGGGGIPDAEWARTHALARAEAEALLAHPSARVVVDDTFCYRFLRDAFRAVAANAGRDVRLIVLATTEAEIRARVAAGARAIAPGARAIAPAVLERNLATFEWPEAGAEPHRIYRAPGDLDGWAADGWLPGVLVRGS